MATELLPVVDIRALSQPDLDALAAASAHALAPRTCPDADPLPPLKIDRAVFNESAGSRKQTFSRLRLAAASSSSSPAAAAARHTSSSSAQRTYDPEAEIVAYHLRRLFVPDDPSLPPPPEPQTLALPQEPASPPDPDRETTNAKGVSVDLLRLAGMVGPYDAELHRRTAGMASDAALQGFIDSLAGKFISPRQRRKNVDASFFGDHLPRGWKLQLGIKRKGGHVWVHCFSYISPKGSKFSTCKEVSAYLMSLLGYPELKPAANQYESTGQHYLSANFGDDNVSGFQDQIGSIMDKTNVHSVPSLAFSSYSSDANDVGERNTGRVNAYECQKCNLTFGDRTSYVQHHLSYHEMSAKRRRTSKFGEPVVGKDGKFECPVCQKTFEEESRYFGHVGSHARYEGLTAEAFMDKATSRRATNDSSAEISFSLQDLTGSHGQNSKVSYDEAGFQHHNHSNEHGDNNSTVTELFSANYSDNLIRTNKTWSRPEVAPSFNDAPSVCRYTNFTGHADVTVPERASISNNQSVSNINGFAGVSMFSDLPGSNHVVRPTAFGTANHYQGQIIDHSRAAPRHADNNTVKARDVNLNSCVNTISFPIANANNETSAALNEANRSSSTAKCFSASFNNNGGASSASSCCGSTNQISSSFGTASKTQAVGSRCIGASYEPYGENFGALKDNPFASKNNTAVYQSNLGTQPVYAVASRADCFASGSMQAKNSDKEFASSAKEQIDNAKNRTSKEAGFVTEAYNRNAFSGGITEKGFAQFSNSFTQTKPNSSGRCSLPAPKTPTNGSDINCIKGSSANRGDVSFTKGSLVNRPINNNEPNVARAPGFDPHAAASASQNANGLVSMQANFGSMPSTVQSAADVSMTSTSQDQCDLQLGFGAQKQQIFSSHGQLRTATAGSPPPGSISKTSSLPTESSQFGSMNGPKSFPSRTSQFGGFARPTLVPAAPSQFGSMAQPNHVHSAQSSQFTSLVQSNSIPPAESSQFGSKAQSSSVPPAKTSQFRGMAGPNSGPPAQSSQFGSMTRPNSVPPESSQFFGSMARPNSQNSVPPVSSQFANMPSQNFVSASEPTLVLGYAPQIGSGPPPQVQSGWDLSLPRMVTGGSMVTCLCIWCNSQFHHFGPFDGQQPSSFGFICPTCKDRMSGHHNVPNNGSWQS